MQSTTGLPLPTHKGALAAAGWTPYCLATLCPLPPPPPRVVPSSGFSVTGAAPRAALMSKGGLAPGQVLPYGPRALNMSRMRMRMRLEHAWSPAHCTASHPMACVAQPYMPRCGPRGPRAGPGEWGRGLSERRAVLSFHALLLLFEATHAAKRRNQRYGGPPLGQQHNGRRPSAKQCDVALSHARTQTHTPRCCSRCPPPATSGPASPRAPCRGPAALWPAVAGAGQAPGHGHHHGGCYARQGQGEVGGTQWGLVGGGGLPWGLGACTTFGGGGGRSGQGRRGGGRQGRVGLGVSVKRWTAACVCAAVALACAPRPDSLSPPLEAVVVVVVAGGCVMWAGGQSP